jgi:hypothetical protein
MTMKKKRAPFQRRNLPSWIFVAIAVGIVLALTLFAIINLKI